MFESSSPTPPPPARLPTKPNRTTEIGLGLTAFGFLFTLLGMMFFFDRGLLAMGNVSCSCHLARRPIDARAARSRSLTLSTPQTNPKPKQQLLFLAGMTMTIGLQSTVQFFSRRKNRRGSLFYLGGAALVVVGWTFVGFLVEGYGFWCLFAAFLPTCLSYLRRVPFLAKVLDNPALKSVINRVQITGGLPR